MIATIQDQAKPAAGAKATTNPPLALSHRCVRSGGPKPPVLKGRWLPGQRSTRLPAPEIRRTDCGVTISGQRRFVKSRRAPDWPGAINGKLRSTGALRDGAAGLLAHVDARELGGSLRKRPLSGRATVDVDGDAYKGDVALKLGASSITAKVAPMRALLLSSAEAMVP